MRVTLLRDLATEGWPSMERYADELGAALRALGLPAQDFVVRRPWPQLRGRAGAWLNLAWRLAVYPLAARRQRSDLYHVLDHSYAHLLTQLPAGRALVTCHDLAPLALDEGRGLSRRVWDQALACLPRAAGVLADSHHTRAELVQRAGLAAERVSVVPLGVRPRPRPADMAPAAGQPPIILHVGSCAPRKNIATLLRALAQVPAARFVQVGGSFTADQHALVQALALQDRVALAGRVSEGALQDWYARATVFVFPSQYEGFGLPVLEAMAAGLPVICSNASSLPEVAGEAALLFDPGEPDALAELIRLVLGDPARRRQLSAAGLARAAEFTWERTAQATAAVYARVWRGPA